MPASFFPPFIIVPFSADRSSHASNVRIINFKLKRNLSFEICCAESSSSSSKSKIGRNREEEEEEKTRIFEYSHNIIVIIARFSQHKARIRSINSTLSLLVIINSGINGVAAISVEQKSAISVKLRRSSSREWPLNFQKLDFLRKQHPFQQHPFPDEFPRRSIEAEREKTWPNIMEHSGRARTHTRARAPALVQFECS